MKTPLASWLVINLLTLLPAAYSADADGDSVIPAGLINIYRAGPQQILIIYTELTGKALVTSSNVNAVTNSIVLQPQVDLKQSEAVKLLEKALIEQAGIVLTKLDDKRVSVTYNDALPITVVTNARPLPRLVGPDGKPWDPPAPLPVRPPATPIHKSFEKGSFVSVATIAGDDRAEVTALILDLLTKQGILAHATGQRVASISVSAQNVSAAHRILANAPELKGKAIVLERSE